MADDRVVGFDPALRVTANVPNIKWLILDKLLAAGESFNKEATRVRARRKHQGGSAAQERGAKRKPLREREPW